ncbi:sorting nexin-16 isoform X1 [Alligator mississippiensis]|uniref:sorting nexin-16 isoform X1 n=2 Tax=Alligator mississippiensis TaxID=8496 RepID=UPI0007112F21|nr:sorting nexin-16 isoform X1 [Alligator mississippiensis]XP_019342500.1 sorting nexin-16 isoform X1 [Alligator mississippiensis]XP_019342504.1 sorting nexin-16 isoform X1 [Alligator mississippiensis]XP_019342512.1 sorting nexin-16 isoform X1 [Alligator mississippiensis]
MTTPYVPVPIPIGNSSNLTTNRNQRRSSFGSISTSLNSSRGQLEDSTSGSFKKMSVPDQIGSTSSVNSSPLVRTKFTGTDTSIEYCTRPMEDVEQNADSGSWEDRPSTPTILGYEVMEERAKFTVYKILVKRSSEESWVVFRRYTDFSRLNDKLKDMFPGFRLALPPKRWFKDNYNPDFLEDRQLGLQAFLQNLVAHKDIANCLAVREFLCLDDPPGPFDSLEESRAFCETLEETNYRLQKELLDKQREVESLKKLLNEKQLHIEAIEKRIRSATDNNFLQIAGQNDPSWVRGRPLTRDFSLGKSKTRRMSGEESECSGEVESSAIEADQGELAEDSCSDKETREACWSGSLAESSVPEIEVAEVAYTADEEE